MAVGRDRLRMITHLDVDDEAVDRLCEVIEAQHLYDRTGDNWLKIRAIRNYLATEICVKINSSLLFGLMQMPARSRSRPWFTASDRLRIPVFLVANGFLQKPPYPLVSVVQVSKV